MATAAVLAALLLGTAACGGGSKPATTTPTTTPAPGANVDPNANGTFTGPINQAKRTAAQQEQYDQQMNEQIDSQP